MIIELYSGIGRFETEETVVYISNDITTKPTIVADVRYLPLKKGIKPHILHGSPPCRYISKARARGANFKGLSETFYLYASFYEAADWLEPENITFEAPANIELWMRKRKFVHKKYDIDKATTNLYYSSNKQKKRAMLNDSVRKAILDIDKYETTE